MEPNQHGNQHIPNVPFTPNATVSPDGAFYRNTQNGGDNSRGIGYYDEYYQPDPNAPRYVGMPVPIVDVVPEVAEIPIYSKPELRKSTEGTDNENG